MLRSTAGLSVADLGIHKTSLEAGSFQGGEIALALSLRDVLEDL
jgi:hypothetical protein